MPPGHSNPNRYQKRYVRQGYEKQERLEQIEAALLERIERIAREFDDLPEHFRDVTSVRRLLDDDPPSIEVVD
jgi:hypothetical protein